MNEINEIYTVEFCKDKKRYIIINSNTGEIVDDAQGYGFKTKQGAYKALYYKLNKKSIDSFNNEYNKIWKQHPNLKNIQDDLNDILLNYLKNNEKIKKQEIDNYILSKIEIEIPELYSIIQKDEKFKKSFLIKFKKNNN